MNLPEDLKYVASHEWVRLEDDGSVTVGISDHAQEQLGDVVFVEVPEVDGEVEAGDAIAVVESVKTASDIYAPISGTVKAVNEALEAGPELVNDDAYGEGWLFSIEPSDPLQLEELLSASSYEASIAEG